MTQAICAAEILRTAADIVDGARNQIHGDKERSFAAIANFWNVYLDNRADPLAPILARDVAAMMVQMKIARAEHGTYIEDHAVDMAGYAAIYGELRNAEQPKPERKA